MKFINIDLIFELYFGDIWNRGNFNLYLIFLLLLCIKLSALTCLMNTYFFPCLQIFSEQNKLTGLCYEFIKLVSRGTWNLLSRVHTQCFTPTYKKMCVLSGNRLNVNPYYMLFLACIIEWDHCNNNNLIPKKLCFRQW